MPKKKDKAISLMKMDAKILPEYRLNPAIHKKDNTSQAGFIPGGQSMGKLSIIYQLKEKRSHTILSVDAKNIQDPFVRRTLSTPGIGRDFLARIKGSYKTP